MPSLIYLPKNRFEFWYLVLQDWAMPIAVLGLTLAVTMSTASTPDWTEVRASLGTGGGAFGLLQLALKKRWIEIRFPKLQQGRIPRGEVRSRG
jgi:hypothetical protein